MKICIIILLILDAVWFASAFWFFSLNPKKAAKLLLSKQHRQEPSFSILTHSLKFLGGMNLAFSTLSIFCLVSIQNIAPAHISFLLLVFSIAHGSQLVFNIPIARKERSKEPHLWSVLSGTMLFIFVVDASLSLLNLFFAVALVLLL
jgi:hypothetical protein